MTMQFDRDTFAKELGTSFLLKDPEGRSVNVELIEVSEVKERPSQLSYSMLFRVPEDHMVGQGLYDLEHDNLGPMQLFLVPIIPTADGNVLEAVINQLRVPPPEVSE
jgi:hypothetical protein